MARKKTLQPDLIAKTAEVLLRRVHERFPDSGLHGVFTELKDVADRAAERAQQLARPLIPLRIAVWFLSIVLLAGLVFAVYEVRLADSTSSNLSDLLQGADAAVNLVLLLGAGIISLWKWEERLKRREALALIHRLRELAHVVDMHQLTKDPEAVVSRAAHTASSPERKMTVGELGRYLDYCTEGLSLIGKIAALYVQKVQDPVVLEAVDGIEDLTTGLSRKIWQKIAVLHGVQIQ